MPKKQDDSNRPAVGLGGANIKNLDSMVAAGMMTQAQADKIKAAKGKQTGRSLFGLFKKGSDDS